MNNEPVAWIVKSPDGEYLVFEKSEHPVMADCTYIPLYTHPVNPYQSITNTKIEPTVVSYTHPAELTDEEILIVWTSSNFVRYTENGHIDEIFFNKFARAILKKANK